MQLHKIVPILDSASISPVVSLWHHFVTYFVNIIVVDGFVKLVVEVVEELDSLSCRAEKGVINS